MTTHKLPMLVDPYLNNLPVVGAVVVGSVVLAAAVDDEESV